MSTITDKSNETVVGSQNYCETLMGSPDKYVQRKQTQIPEKLKGNQTYIKICVDLLKEISGFITISFIKTQVE